MRDKDFDLAILGSGPAGYSAAYEALKYGQKIILFEKYELGGTCLNRGCVPTKYLAHIARKYRDCFDNNEGIIFEKPVIDFKKTIEKMNSIISLQRKALYDDLTNKGICFVHGEAKINSCNSVLCNNKEYKTSNIIICTGSRSKKPFIDDAITSDELLALEEIPTKMNIVGGGTIAVEFASIYQMLGSKVSIYIRGDRILRKWDKEVAVSISQSFKKRGIEIHKKFDFSDKSSVSLEQPNSSVVTLSAVGRERNVVPSEFYDFGETGGIVTNEYYQTRTDNIYAVGDVIEGSPFLAHTAMEQGRCAVRSMAEKKHNPKKAIIRCIYLNQEVACAGITDDDNLNIIGAKVGMYSNARTMISTNERGFLKIFADKENHTVKGAVMMCERAGDMISELALAIDNGLTVEKMLETVRPHPSYSEAITDALRILEGKLCED